MRAFVIGLLGIVLVHGGAVAQTTQEQENILRTFQQNATELAAQLTTQLTTQPYCCYQSPNPLTTATWGPRIFTPPVATVFRQLIAKALDQQVSVSQMSSVGVPLPLEHHPVAFELFPATELHEFPALLARTLPRLPRALEYRLIGNDLVLRDINADVIVAVLRDAIGRATAAQR